MDFDVVSDGYSADASSSNEESDGSVNSSSSGEPNAKNQRKGLKRPARSPIHPDLDFSLTTHMTTSNDSSFDATSLHKTEQNCEHPTASKCAMPQEVIAQLLVNYFANLSPRGASSEETPDCLKRANLSVDENEKAISDIQHTSRYLPDLKSLEATESTEKTMFSSQCRFLDGALSLTPSPRLLVEAAHPHRVIHANAAFSSSMLGKSESPQQWIEQTNVYDKSGRNQSISEMMHNLFSNVPVTVYPVIGSGRISHYLVEVEAEAWPRSSTSPAAKRARTDLETPSLAIG